MQGHNTQETNKNDRMKKERHKTKGRGSVVEKETGADTTADRLILTQSLQVQAHLFHLTPHMPTRPHLIIHSCQI